MGRVLSKTLPVALTGPLSGGVTAVAAGVYHSLAVRDGGVYAWGYNVDGQLGDGTKTNRYTPVALTGALSSGVSAIAAGLLLQPGPEERQRLRLGLQRLRATRRRDDDG